MTTPPFRLDPNGRWCPTCEDWAIGCILPSVHGRGWFVPEGHAQAPRQRSVVGTTLLVMLTVFVIAPLILIAACSVLGGLAVVSQH